MCLRLRFPSLLSVALVTSTATASLAGEAVPAPEEPARTEGGSIDREQPSARPADDRPAVQSESSSARSLRNDPHTTVEAGLALQALPAAEVCPISPDNCEQGETSIAISLRNLYHLDPFAFGAGILWAFGLRSDAAAGDSDGSLGREHARSYFAFEGLFRYYFFRAAAWELWTGATVGGVVVRDSWSTLADREPYSDFEQVGPREQTISTWGFAAGLGVGFQWNFTDAGIFGTRVRYSNWVFPDERELLPTGDPVSLAGRVDVFDFGLTVAYRLPI
jgi:hypothetical protein